MKLKTGLVREHREKQEWQAGQQKLKEKHNIQDSNVVVVEKRHYILAALKILWAVVRVICTICIFAMATAGLISIVYPSVRSELISVLNEIWNTLSGYF